MSVQRKRILRYSIVIFLIVLAICLEVLLRIDRLCLYMSINDAWMVERIAAILRSILYVCIFVYWDYWLDRRLVHPQVRIAMLGVNRLILLWMALRFFRYYLVLEPQLRILLWYSYYFPMLFIPVLVSITAHTLGKTETYRLPHWTGSLFWISFLLFLLVFTNNIHSLVFHITSTSLYHDEYTYGIGYYLICVWIVLLLVNSLVVMVRHCRIPGRNRIQIIPVLPLLFMMVYLVLYAMDFPLDTYFISDVTLVICICIGVSLESCIYLGLIQSNSAYRELLEGSSVPLEIVDDTMHPTFLHHMYLSAEQLYAAKYKTILLDERTRLSSHRINGGYVYWTEDVSKIQCALAQLSELADDLDDRNYVLQRENEAKRKVLEWEEKNRLYNMLIEKMEPTIQSYIQCIDRAKHQPEDKEAMVHVALVSVYIKRRTNLLMLMQMHKEIAAKELYFCIRESLEYLSLLGVQNECVFLLDGTMEYDEMAYLYDVFQEVIMTYMKRMHALFVSVSQDEQGIQLCIRTDVLGVVSTQWDIQEEDEEQILTIRWDGHYET